MLFGIDNNTFRSFLPSPVKIAMDQAHRMARQRVEAGGTVAAHEGAVEEPVDGDFILPDDADPFLVALAIDTKLRNGRKAPPGLGDDPMQLLERRVGGRIVVSGHHLLRLGDGNFAKGREFMRGLVTKLRRRR